MSSASGKPPPLDAYLAQIVAAATEMHVVTHAVASEHAYQIDRLSAEVSRLERALVAQGWAAMCQLVAEFPANELLLSLAMSPDDYARGDV